MTQQIYISFLGLGNYDEISYTWGDQESTPTPYAQEAELELLFSEEERAKLSVLILGTQRSKAKHWERQLHKNHETKEDEDRGPGLRPRLETYKLKPEFVEISENLKVDKQWETFKQILNRVPPNAQLTVDITHGFRAVPVVISSALHFLKLARSIELRHVLYGIDKNKPPSIFDYGEFYAIGDWTDGVSRLVEEADASKLVRVAQMGYSLDLPAFSDGKLSQALLDISDAVKGVDVHGFEPKVRAALELINQGIADAKVGEHSASQVLLELIQDKFQELALKAPHSGHYDDTYFELQLKFIKLLLEHRLFMQAFTAMREYIGSLGMRAYKPGKLSYREEHIQRRLVTGVFLPMLTVKKNLIVQSGSEKAHRSLLPYVDLLIESGLKAKLAEILEPLATIRNGFDHAWTSHENMTEEIAEKGDEFLARLESITPQILNIEPPLPEDSQSKPKPAFLVLMNHPLSEEQRKQIRGRGAGEPILAPDSLRDQWSNVSPKGKKLPQKLKQGLDEWFGSAKEGDQVLIHGEPGASFLAVQLAFKHQLKPLYATTEREVIERVQADGSIRKESVFRHVGFRYYSKP